MKKIVVANVFKEKGKQAFFALHQIQQKIKQYDSSIDVEFHILWDLQPNEKESHWVNLIDNYGFNLNSYNKQFFIDYAVNVYSQDRDKTVKNFGNFFAINVLMLFHYLRRVKMFDHCLRYDDDILINYDFFDVIELCLNKTSVLITEPYNTNCDKVMLEKLMNLYGGYPAFEFYKNRNPKVYGFNSGFQGIDLSIYDDFLSSSDFETFLNLFEFKSIFDENGKEIWGVERFLIDTQEQSFAGVMNILKSRKDPFILDPKTCYVAPNWGEHPELGPLDPNDDLHGWGVCLKSKISHFIGHTHGKGKPKEFFDVVDAYLKQNNLMP